MIEYQSFTLDNGLQVLVHEDPSTSLAAVNILYNVGSRDESEHKTGFAHLFEHLMFGGSKHIDSYDQPLQHVGGENNAFTTPDITNYYLTLPAPNLETAFWLESDRMLSLSFDPQVLEVQRKVVIEEFKQRYLNQPYGDVWLKLRPIAYQLHPYRWATIGKDISHIENATMQDVRDFFKKFYHPANAILVVAGNVKYQQVCQLAGKWFGGIKAGPAYRRDLPQEPIQSESRIIKVSADVPLDAFYQVYHIPPRFTESYHQADLISDILGRGKSSKLYQTLVKERQMFSAISSYITGSLDPGLMVIQGQLLEGFSCDQGHRAVREIIDEMLTTEVTEEELQKVKNQAESSLVFGKVPLLNRAMNLALGALVGDADYINKEDTIIQDIKAEDIMALAPQILRENNSTTMYYQKQS
ncbi:MAG: insulinase family protein [Cyclobacteriaceae bacterium]|nr:insulinase family protein [Cyclobacteriaceae bacterium]